MTFATIYFYIKDIQAMYSYLHRVATHREQTMMTDPQYQVYLNLVQMGEQEKADELFTQLAMKYRLFTVWTALDDLEDILIFYLITPELQHLVPLC